MVDFPDWIVRVDGRASEPLLEVLRSPVGRLLLDPCEARPDVFDLRLRRVGPGRASACLHAGPRALLVLVEGEGRLRATVDGLDVLVDATVEELAAASSQLGAALEPVLQTALRAEPAAAARLEAVLANGGPADVAVLGRRIEPAYPDAGTAKALGEDAALPALGALLAHRRQPSGGDAAALLDGAPALLAIDGRSALLAIEVADAADVEGAELALVRARAWAELLARWIGDDPLARIRLLDLLDQRRALGLARAEADLTPPLRVIPVLALGPGPCGPEPRERLDALGALLRDTPVGHAAVQRAERWELDGSGRRLLDEPSRR